MPAADLIKTPQVIDPEQDLNAIKMCVKVGQQIARAIGGGRIKLQEGAGRERKKFSYKAQIINPDEEVFWESFKTEESGKHTYCPIFQ